MVGGIVGTTTSRRPRAVLFDLFNTLVPGGSRGERDDVSCAAALLLGVAPQAFAASVRDTFDDRTRGRLGDLQQTLNRLAVELGGTPTPEALAGAAKLRLDLTRSLHARSWAVPALVELRRSGYQLGVVSDCSAETPVVWPQSPLAPYVDAVSFSCITGHRKPEPAAFLHATAAMGLDPSECAYVGDGGSHELTGAQALGMQAIRFAPPNDSRGDCVDADDDWAGVTLYDLTNLVALLS